MLSLTCFLALWALICLSVNAQNRDVSVSQACFDVGESISVSYQAADVQNFDEVWIGIYNGNGVMNNQNLGNGLLWLYLCGSQTCDPFRFASSGRVSFGANSNWDGSWPLPAGNYQAVLSASTNNRWRSITGAATFRVGCGGTPSPPSPPSSTMPPSNTGPEAILVSSTCIGAGSPVSLSFSGVSDRNIFIGIYRENSLGDISSLPSNGLVDWMWSCGNTSGCPNWPRMGNVQFNNLSRGRYRAVLASATQSPFVGLAATQTFEVGCSTGGTTPPPTPRPSLRPTPPPTQGLTVTVQTIQDARRDIENLINGNQLLPGKFLRLAFHDCVGGCDGCVDMSHPDNAGLAMPINALRPLEDEYENRGLSRTDLWMLSAVVAADVSVPGVSFPFRWVGRQTCEDLNNNNCGFGFDGQRSTCGRFGGPNRPLCHGDIDGTQEIATFMAQNFGFNAEQTVAIMGAHSIGAMRDVNVGFEGRSGWDLTNDEIDRGYFLELVGNGGDPVDNAPNWRQVLHQNGDLPNIPDRWQFELTVNGTPLTMLNADIALVRNLVKGANLQDDGRVTCDFKGPNACSSNTPFMRFVRQYASDEAGFIADFRDTLDLLIDTGYARDGPCGTNSVCTLRSL